MKPIKLIVIVTALFLANSMNAQIAVSLSIGSPPAWAPYGYSEARYYYIPDVEAYYDVQSSMFIYMDGGVWVHRGYLPSRYRDYDLYGGYKVVMTDYHGNSPYTHFNENRRMYARGYHREGQRTVGERPRRENSREKISHEEKHENKEVRHDNDKRVEHADEKRNGHDNDKHESRGNGKNMKEEHGHGDEKDKK
jgi:hypothetical protein